MDTKKRKTKNLIHLKVVDFSLWNGFKFGVGFTIGSICVSIVLGIIMFIFTMLAAIGMPPLPLH